VVVSHVVLAADSYLAVGLSPEQWAFVVVFADVVVFLLGVIVGERT
jgi:hypothetical protein